MKTAIGWIVSAFFVAMGLTPLLRGDYLSGGVMLLTALLLSPIITKILSTKEIAYGVKPKAIVILTAITTFGWTSMSFEKEKEAQIAEQKFQQNLIVAKKKRENLIASFNENKAQIISEIDQLILTGDDLSALQLVEKYRVTGDALVGEKYRSLKTKQLDNQLDTISGDTLQSNSDRAEILKQLVSLNPQNTAYRKKQSDVNSRISDIKEIHQKLRDRKEKIESQFSSWDGSHIRLQRVIKKNLKDPDSYEHAETKYWDKGDHLIVETKYRGKNSFGAVVLEEARAKISLDGQILAINQ